MLLLVCSAITTLSAQQKGKQDNVPYNVKALFYTILKTWGSPTDEVYFVNKNPDTNQIEQSVKITYFVADNDKFPHMAGKTYLNLSSITDAFRKDEPKSYQILHISPDDKQSFSLKTVDESGHEKIYPIRLGGTEEMWLLCCKNPDNPKLRDAYAIKWTLNNDQSKILGAIYQITSLRPDMYEKNMSSAGLLSDNQNTFTIDGRVGFDLTDSLYVVYMADTAEELDKVADNDYVATMPVVNKRFSFSVQLDKPKVGRIRTVMPDGSLCQLWTNLDFVPGETYRITTHNGYYDEDRDYERRVGRYSGKSLLNRPQIQGIDDQVHQIQIDTIPGYTGEEFQVIETRSKEEWRNSLGPNKIAQLEMQASVIEMNEKRIKAEYQEVKQELDGIRSGYRIEMAFQEILKQNKALDKKYQSFLRTVKAFGVPSCELPDLYQVILKFYTDQNKALSDFYRTYGHYTKSARKTQQYVNKQLEKYIKEMEKMLLINKKNRMCQLAHPIFFLCFSSLCYGKVWSICKKYEKVMCCI